MCLQILEVSKNEQGTLLCENILGDAYKVIRIVIVLPCGTICNPR